MQPDRAEEGAGQADDLAVRREVADADPQLGQVALQHVAADLARAGDALLRVGEEPAQPGGGRGSPGDLAGTQSPAQLPPGPALGEIFQPGLRDGAEPDVGVRCGDAQVPQPPDVTGVLHVPAAAVVQIFDLAARLDARDRAWAAPDRASRPSGQPLFLRPVQQGMHAAGRGGPDELLDTVRRRAEPPVVTALHRVLHLEPQVRGSRPNAKRSWPGTASSHAAGTSCPIGGRPAVRHRARWVMHSGAAPSAHKLQPRTWHGSRAARVTCGAAASQRSEPAFLRSASVRDAGRIVRLPAARSCSPGPGTAAPPDARPAQLGWWRRSRRCRDGPGPSTGGNGPGRCRGPGPRARTPEPGTAARRTGSPGSTVNTAARNSGRTAASSFSSSPG